MISRLNSLQAEISEHPTHEFHLSDHRSSIFFKKKQRLPSWYSEKEEANDTGPDRAELSQKCSVPPPKAGQGRANRGPAAPGGMSGRGVGLCDGGAGGGARGPPHAT